MIWRVTESSVVPLEETDLASEDFFESNLEDWIETHPEILEEQLLIIGRQVAIQGVGDKIDLLGVDPQGALVVIELKRGTAGGDVDFQALRYASYVSRWSYNEIRTQAERYAAAIGKGEDFVDTMEEFLDKGADLNSTQRIIIVGRRLRNKIGSVALWLLERDVDIKVVELVPYRQEDGTLYISPTIVVPPPTAEEYEIGRAGAEEPWLRDGRSWHLRERCSEATAQMLERIEAALREFPDVAISWQQKFYVGFTAHGIQYYWGQVHTYKTQLNVEVRLPAGRCTEEGVAEAIGLPLERVAVENYDERFDTVKLKLSPSFDISGTGFVEFLREAHELFPSIWTNQPVSVSVQDGRRDEEPSSAALTPEE